MRSFRRQIGILVVLFVTVVFSCMVSASAGNSVQTATTKSNALKAYKKMLTKSQIPFWDSTKEKTSKLKFGICYIDNNNIPELVISLYDCPRIYTFYKGKVKQIYYKPEVEQYIYCYQKTGLYYEWHDDMGGPDVSRRFYLLKNGKDKEKISCTESKKYAENTMYFSGNTFISKTRFYQLLRSLSKGKQAKRVKMYKNTAANRKKYLK